MIFLYRPSIKRVESQYFAKQFFRMISIFCCFSSCRHCSVLLISAAWFAQAPKDVFCCSILLPTRILWKDDTRSACPLWSKQLITSTWDKVHIDDIIYTSYVPLGRTTHPHAQNLKRLDDSDPAFPSNWMMNTPAAARPMCGHEDSGGMHGFWLAADFRQKIVLRTHTLIWFQEIILWNNINHTL